MTKTIHNPDQYMGDLRQILAQGKKRMGILIGAGGPASLTVDKKTGCLTPDGEPLVPAIAGLTKLIFKSLEGKYDGVLESICKDVKSDTNIEIILSRVRTLADALGDNIVYGLNGPGFGDLGAVICDEIGKAVCSALPDGPNAYSELAGWIGGTVRNHPFELFTTNYDLLMEEAFERAHIPYFDGFCGSREPFFDAATIGISDLPARWARLWKLHGSLGWDINSRGEIVRGKGINATRLIYPTHLKYEQTQKMPYTAFFDRLRKFLTSPDSLLITSGFSFLDSHLTAVIDESLSANRAATVIAFQYCITKSEEAACHLAKRRANMSVYAKDGAVINCIEAKWLPGDLPHPAWAAIRASYWGKSPGAKNDHFLLGDFSTLARYIALTRTEQFQTPTVESVPIVGVPS
jgi:SIR2-like domain